MQIQSAAFSTVIQINESIILALSVNSALRVNIPWGKKPVMISPALIADGVTTSTLKSGVQVLVTPKKCNVLAVIELDKEFDLVRVASKSPASQLAVQAELMAMLKEDGALYTRFNAMLGKISPDGEVAKVVDCLIGESAAGHIGRLKIVLGMWLAPLAELNKEKLLAEIAALAKPTLKEVATALEDEQAENE